MPKTVTSGGDGKRYPLNMRTTKEVREKLEASARESGRSLAQEVEIRLQRSFDRANLLPDVLTLAYGRKLAGVLMMLGYAMRDAGREAAFFITRMDDAELWLSDPFEFDQARQAADHILAMLRPDGEIKVPAIWVSLAEIWEGKGVPWDCGKEQADRVILAVADDGSTEPREEGAKVADLLGSLADHLKKRIKEQ